MKSVTSHHLELSSGKIKLSCGSTLTSLNRDNQEITFQTSELREVFSMLERAIKFREENQTKNEEA